MTARDIALRALSFEETTIVAVAEVEAAVDRCVDLARGRGGVLIAPSSSIGPEVPAENIAAMYRRVRERNAEVG